MSSRLFIIAVSFCAAAVATPARGDSFWQPAGPAAAADSYESLMARGDRYTVRAADIKFNRAADSTPLSPEYMATVKKAVEAYEQAARARPTAAEPHYRAAEVLNAHVLDDSNAVYNDRAAPERALAHCRAFSELAPLDPRVAETLFRRAIVYTKLATEADFQQAIGSYEALLASSDLDALDAREAAIWLSNLAETYMMVGRLSDAIAYYERSLTYNDRASYGYGLAVALDRAGQLESARQVMYSYARDDRLSELEEGSTFYVPEGELYYYKALGYESLGEIELAIRYYNMFIASGAHPRYQPRAREHVATLRKRPQRPKKDPGTPLPIWGF
jgi:tetratricopeptide (TPR) repeat protein